MTENLAGQGRPDVITAAWRHFSGAHPSGHPMTDAGWTVRGAVVLHPAGRVRRFYHRPRLHRAAIRWAWSAGVAGELYGLATAPGVTIDATGVTAGAATAYAGYRTAEAVTRWSQHRRVIKPLAKALAGPLQDTPEHILQEMRVRGRLRGKSAQVIIPVHDGWHGDRRLVENVVTTRLGGDWDVEWKMLRAPFTVQFSRRIVRPVPKRVTYADVAHLLAAPPSEHHVLIGLGAGGEPVWLDRKDENPNIGVSAGVGAGKSYLMLGIAAQTLARGGEVTLIRPKARLYNCLAGVPGMRLCRGLEEEMQGIEEFHDSMEERYGALDPNSWGGPDPMEGLPTKFLILEEQVDFMLELGMWWQENKPKGAKGKAPAINQIGKILVKGREARHLTAGVYQSMTVASTGGIVGIRDQYGAKLLGRFSAQQWAMLTGTNRGPRSQDHAGRMVLVTGRGIEWVQTILWTQEEAREFALAGRAPVDVPVSRPSVPMWTKTRDDDQEESVYITGTGTGTRGLTLIKSPAPEDAVHTPAGPARRLWTLPEAAREGIVSLTYEALRKARQRPGFPAPVDNDGRQDRWTAEQLTEWENGRGRAVSSGQ